VSRNRAFAVRGPTMVHARRHRGAHSTGATPQCNKYSLTLLQFFVTLRQHRFPASRVYQELDVDKVRAAGPAMLHSATELPRVLMELASLTWSWPLLTRARRGDGHSVLVLPGFTAGDESTLILRRVLDAAGYQSVPWALGQNTGSLDLQEQLFHRFDSLTRDCDRKMSIVGQSLGGVFARELARQWPERVRQVIALGSPFASSGPETTNGLVSRLFQYLSGMSQEQMRDRMLGFAPEPPPVPSTAIYSKADGVVHWSSCLEYQGQQSENIEVHGSHTGMAMNPLVLHVLLDRLALPDGAWRPFRRDRGCRAFLYPTPEPLTEVTTCAS
jgi:pimeloyl-ACP methyl ester carboxylesterase